MQYIKFKYQGKTYKAAIVHATETGYWVSLVTIKPAIKDRQGVKMFVDAKSVDIKLK